MVTPPAERLEPAERLRRARRDVVFALDDRDATVGPVTSDTPIRALPDDVGSVVVSRVEAGLTPAGPEFPRRPLLKRIAMPSTALAVLDIVLLVVALAVGSGTAAVVAAVLLVIFAAAAVTTTRHAAADPLRITPEQRRAIEASGRWTPSRAWPDAGPRRNVVALAAATAQRIVDTAAWRHGVLARGGIVLSLAAELDLVETQAAQSAHTEADTEADDEWARLLTRVAALLAYAGVVETLDADEHTVAPEQDDVEMLAFFLSGAIYEVR